MFLKQSRPLVRSARCLSYVLALVLSPHALGQRPLTWTSVGGTSLQAELVRMEGESVVLKVDDSAAAVSVPLSKLSPESRAQANLMWFNSCDAKQFQMIRQHLPAMTERPGAVSRLLLEIHKAVPESPYAGIWAAVGISEGENDIAFAKRLLNQAIDRIEQQRAVMPARHSMTLASAQNNLAVVSLKEKGTNQAAAALIEAVECSSLVAPIIEHNIQLVAQADSQQDSAFELAPRLRSNLLTTLASAQVSTTKPKLSNNVYYTLDFDLPLAAGAASRKINGLESPNALMELIAVASGFVVAPGMVMTSVNAIATENFAGPKLLSVGTYQGGVFKNLVSKNCLLTRSRAIATRSTIIRSPSRYPTTLTNFRFVDPRPGSAQASLAVLHVPGLDAPPLPIATGTPTVGDQFQLLGYRPGQDLVMTGMQSFPGQVQSPPDRNGAQRVSHETNNGNRGGPLIGTDNAVHGIVFAMDDDPLKSSGKAFGAPMLRSWFNRHVQTTSLVSAEDVPVAERPDSSRSVVPVFVWGTRRSSGLLSEIADGSGPSESLFIENSWCLNCRGTGMRDCPACVQGKQSYRKREIVARTKVAGDIYGTVVKKKTCSNCRGKSKLRCRDCDNGKL